MDDRHDFDKALESSHHEREEAIDDSDVDTDELSNAQKEGMINGQ